MNKTIAVIERESGARGRVTSLIDYFCGSPIAEIDWSFGVKLDLQERLPCMTD
jgi:hypothetical protein